MFEKDNSYIETTFFYRIDYKLANLLTEHGDRPPSPGGPAEAARAAAP